MKKSIISTLFISLFVLLGTVHSVSATSFYPLEWTKCTNEGGTLFSSNGPEYSPDSCSFPNGFSCNVFDGSCDKRMYTSLDQLPSSCISAYDGCNNCFRASGGAWACTLMACLDVKQPAVRCTGYADTKPLEEPMMCTKEYIPVCGEKYEPCIAQGNLHCNTGAMPTQKTYSNKCMMQADGASLVSEGECKQEIKTYGCPANMVDGGCGVNPKPSFCQVPKIKLQKGSKGKYVVELQESLKQLGLEFIQQSPGNSDGVFGNKLSGSLKYFQKYVGLKPDGIFGKLTKDIICSYPLVRVSPIMPQ